MHWPSSEPFDDLFQVACVGLLGAIDRFDAGRGIPFSVFAVPTVLGELKHHLRRTMWSAHVPRRTQQLAQRVEAAARTLATTSNRSASVEEIAHYLEIGTERVLVGLDAARAHHALSLEALLSGVPDQERPLTDSLARDEAGYGRVELTAALATVARQLTVTERRAFALRFEHDLTQDEIARRLGCSQMQVSRLLRKAVTILLTQTGEEDRLRVGTSLRRAPRRRPVGAFEPSVIAQRRCRGQGSTGL